jgi:hypothetical protein
MSEPDKTLTLFALQQTVDVLETRGFKPRIKDGAADLGVGAVSLRCSVPGVQQHPGAVVVAIAGEVLIPDMASTPIQDSAVGTAETTEKAVASGVRAWIDGVLPPVLMARGIGKAEEVHPFDLCQIDFVNNLTNVWDVYAGPFQVAGRDREHLARHLEAQQPFTMLLTSGALPPIATTPGLFWLKLFLSRQESGELTAECRLNNQDWPAGAEALRTFAWPTEPGFLLYRQFIVGKLSKSDPYKPEKKWWQVWK